MINRLLKTESRERFTRQLRLKRRQVARTGGDVEAMADKHFFNRLNQVAGIRRFLASWLALAVLLVFGVAWQVMTLGRYYLSSQPTIGGTYREGLLGSYTNANPIYATGLADSSVASLVFSGLLTYDSENNLVPGLAESWTIDPAGRLYTMKLRDNVKWHDGVALTASDVVFTFQTIQDADARSPLFRNWQGVTVSEVDQKTVTFSLSAALSGFEHSLTTGIIPKHLLAGLPAAQLRSADFNTIKMVGSGPFKLHSVEVSGNTADTRQEVIALDRNADFYLGAPKLEHFVLRIFRNGSQLAEAFKNHEVNAAAGLSTTDIDPGEETVTVYNTPQTGAVMVFLNNSSSLLTDSKVRQALVHATDVPAVIKAIGYPLIEVDLPFLRGQIGYDKDKAQFGFDLAAANRLLDEAGWIRPTADSVREKDGKQLKIKLLSQSLSEYATVVQKLQRQ